MRFGTISAVWVVLAAVISGAAAPAVHGQAEQFFARDRNVAVLERPRPEYDAPGVRSGAFIYRPSIELGLEYDDNIFATGAGEESDFIATLRPQINVESTWSRHEFTADAMVERRQYFDFSDESVWNATAGAAGRADIQRGFTVSAGGRYSKLTEDRSAAGLTSIAAEPIRYDAGAVFGELARESGRFRLTGRINLDTYDFDDAPLIGGGVGDQDFRDRDELAFTARADYAVTPDTALFARAVFNERDYDLAPPAVTFERGSSGYTFDAGADFDIGGVARGELALGYTEQDYDSAAFPDVDGLSVNAQVEWFPTQLTTVTLQGERSIRDSAIVNSGAFVATRASAQVDHELLRNLVITGRVNLGEDDYEGVDRTDDRFEVMASATYLANRNVGVRASLSRLDENSSGAAARPDFTENRFVVSLQFRL
ncbi:MAG: outer membrane beta-barrel protein [Oceanicaulis sp.]